MPPHAQDEPKKTKGRVAYRAAEFEPPVPGTFRPYSERVESAQKPFGGRFLVRGGKLDVLEVPVAPTSPP
ncbi:DUF1330 domain-containing protein [Ralstonia syzygii]